MKKRLVRKFEEATDVVVLGVDLGSLLEDRSIKGYEISDDKVKVLKFLCESLSENNFHITDDYSDVYVLNNGVKAKYMENDGSVYVLTEGEFNEFKELLSNLDSYHYVKIQQFKGSMYCGVVCDEDEDGNEVEELRYLEMNDVSDEPYLMYDLVEDDEDLYLVAALDLEGDFEGNIEMVYKDWDDDQNV